MWQRRFDSSLVPGFRATDAKIQIRLQILKRQKKKNADCSINDASDNHLGMCKSATLLLFASITYLISYTV